MQYSMRGANRASVDILQVIKKQKRPDSFVWSILPYNPPDITEQDIERLNVALSNLKAELDETVSQIRLV
jgi:hypothetical protein